MSIWDRVIAMLLRDHTMFRAMEEHILGNPWTQYSGHGPGTELLGSPESALETGCGTGRSLAHLAQQGVKANGGRPVAAYGAARRRPVGAARSTDRAG